MQSASISTRENVRVSTTVVQVEKGHTCCVVQQIQEANLWKCKNEDHMLFNLACIRPKTRLVAAHPTHQLLAATVTGSGRGDADAGLGFRCATTPPSSSTTVTSSWPSFAFGPRRHCSKATSDSVMIAGPCRFAELPCPRGKSSLPPCRPIRRTLST